ncbi:MAG: hypothetical protein AB7P20_24595 [Rhizobiaceae bacterium]
MSTTEDYEAALLELAQASKAFEPYAAVLKRLKAHKESGGDPKVITGKLPDADKMREAGKRFVTALSAANKAYRGLSKDERERVKAQFPNRKDAL